MTKNQRSKTTDGTVRIDLSRLSSQGKVNTEKVTDYFDHLISSISPIVTFNLEEKIKFVNSSFIKEFSKNQKSILGKNIQKVLLLSNHDLRNFIKNIQNARNGFLINSEFKRGKKVYGYSIFIFDDDTGIILKDITDKKKLESKVKKLHSEILKLQEKERQKLAAELHDGVGQTILAAKLNFLAYKNDPDKYNNKFEIGLELINRVSQELREIYTNLYPSLLTDLGLEAAIRSFLNSLFKPLKTNVECNIDLTAILPHELELNLYRITQEIATNAAKHASPQNLFFNLKSTAKYILLEVKDDGSGYKSNAGNSVGNSGNLINKGFGLENIKRRVDDLKGTVEVNSSSEGTNARIIIPLKNNRRENIKKAIHLTVPN